MRYSAYFFPCVIYTITFSKYMKALFVLQTVYNISIFLIQMKYRLQTMYNHMVGRSGSILSPLYSILLSSLYSPYTVSTSLRTQRCPGYSIVISAVYPLLVVNYDFSYFSPNGATQLTIKLRTFSWVSQASKSKCEANPLRGF